MNRSFVIFAILFSLTACSTQQVKEGAGYAVGTAIVTAATAMALYGGIRDDLEDDCDQQCRAEKQRRDARRQGAEDTRDVREPDAELDLIGRRGCTGNCHGEIVGQAQARGLPATSPAGRQGAVWKTRSCIGSM